jgi:hypothetical protein
VVAKLVELGADVNVQMIHGDMSLHHAAEEGHVEVATMLLGWASWHPHRRLSRRRCAWCVWMSASGMRWCCARTCACFVHAHVRVRAVCPAAAGCANAALPGVPHARRALNAGVD